MHIRRFEAATTAEAVRQIREELGDDALVLSVQKTRRKHGPFGLLSRPGVEVTASVDREVRQGRPAMSSENSSATALPGAEALAAHAAAQPLEGELRLLRAELRALRATREEDGNEIREELEALRRVVLRRGGEKMVEALEGHAASLARAGFAARHAERIAARASGLAMDASIPSEKTLLQGLVDELEANILIPRSDQAPPISFFVGAPGVGKTTTLAKIAAQEDERDDRVSLLTTDTFRIGAEDQLRTYADLLQVPFATAASPEVLAQRVEAFEGSRILIDSAGRGRHDVEAMGDLIELRDRLGERAAVHLVLSAETKEADLRDQVRRYSALRPDDTIVTKVDESDDFTSMANVLLDQATPPLLWLGTGQRVPEDLVLPEADQLAAQLLEAAA
ncbi:MAG: flagellar biosynthesis protein FlhF [Myxococcota bacterium]|jgi:flagellar biosynthesis protein FlhF|nr:flagellar biosynthesis protein FlhF [Myxococcota bacterium]